MHGKGMIVNASQYALLRHDTNIYHEFSPYPSTTLSNALRSNMARKKKDKSLVRELNELADMIEGRR
jgi:hypothetical protein